MLFVIGLFVCVPFMFSCVVFGVVAWSGVLWCCFCACFRVVGLWRCVACVLFVVIVFVLLFLVCVALFFVCCIVLASFFLFLCWFSVCIVVEVCLFCCVVVDLPFGLSLFFLDLCCVAIGLLSVVV